MIKDQDIMDLQAIHSSCQCEITAVSCDIGLLPSGGIVKCGLSP